MIKLKKIFKTFIFVLVVLISMSAKFAYAADTGTDIENYSLDKLLKKYTIVSLGKRDNGSATIFHVTGNYLVNGKLATNIDKYSYYFFWSGVSNVYDMPRCTAVYSSYFSSYSADLCSKYDLNFNNLYNNIVNQQKDIEKGLPILDKGSLELKTGGYYTLKNINDVYEIKFNEFKNNENNLTVITIENEGTVNLPSTYWLDEDGRKNKIITNDTFGGYTNYNSATGEYEHYEVGELYSDNGMHYKYNDIYYGNIIWNIPNATKITFTGVPFMGHVIAPNADATMPESNFSGAMIVNSLKADGYSEGHFYPLTVGNLTADLGKKSIKVTLGCNCEKGVPDPRPNKVTVYITGNGYRVASVELTKENNWTYEYELPKTLDGKTEITYSLEGEYIDKNVSNVDGFNLTAKCSVSNPNTGINTPYLISFAVITIIGLTVFIVRKRKYM